MQEKLTADNLQKAYKGRPVVKGVSLEVNQGEIVGLLGPNGAGKTTLVSILIGIITRDKGEIFIDGLDLDHHLSEIQTICSIVPQNLAIYPMLSAYENLEYLFRFNNELKLFTDVGNAKKFEVSIFNMNKKESAMSISWSFMSCALRTSVL